MLRLPVVYAAGSAIVLAVVLAAAQPLERVVLYAPGKGDPRVAVFDHAEVLDAFQVGRWDTTILPHFFLVNPGRRAIVIARRDRDVGVKITEGPYTGRYGWVPEEDVHPDTQDDL